VVPPDDSRLKFYSPPPDADRREIEADWESVRVRVTPPADYHRTPGFEDRVKGAVDGWLAGRGPLILPPGFTLELTHVP
jgi:hypothetical protein